MKTAPKHLLVVDDERGIREALQMVLSQMGYCVACARDGVEGLALFQKKDWDAVISDRAMPGMNGEEMAGEMKHLRPNVPIILISGLLAKVTRPELFAAMLPKPFLFAELSGCLQRVLS